MRLTAGCMIAQSFRVIISLMSWNVHYTSRPHAFIIFMTLLPFSFKNKNDIVLSADNNNGNG